MPRLIARILAHRRVIHRQAFTSAPNLLPKCGMAIILLMSNPHLQAQNSDWYQVEIILFARIDPRASGEENTSTAAYPDPMMSISPSSDALIQPEKLTQLAEIIRFESIRRRLPEVPGQYEEDIRQAENAVPPEASISEATGSSQDSLRWSPNQPESFRLLPGDDRLLNDVAGNISRSRDYRFIRHHAWRQPISTADEAIPILIQAGKHYADDFEIDGYITIRKSRYLHVDTHLWFNEFALRDLLSSRTATPTVASQMPAGISLAGYNKLKTWEASRHAYEIIRTHKMQQSRKMRSNSLHYIDHPYFGILISITRYSPAPAADQQPAAKQPPSADQAPVRISTDKS